jgi:putative SOS response-associated peptidase YedK
MCGRYTSTAAFDELALRFGITVESGSNNKLTARYNIAPSQTIIGVALALAAATPGSVLYEKVIRRFIAANPPKVLIDE